MALRLRRGLNIDRQSIVFAEGELIYTTDSQEIYVGDGSTPGGIRVTGAVTGSPAQLSQNLDLNGYNIQGSGNVNVTSVSGDGSGLTNLPSPDSLTGDLNLNTNEIIGSGNININGTVNAIAFAGDGSGLTNVSTGVQEGLEYSIDIRGNVISNTSTIMVNHETGTFTGTFVGDGSALINLPTPDLSYSTWPLNILSGDGSTVIVNSATDTFTGTFVGDGSGLTNLPAMPGSGVTEGETYNIDITGNVLGFDSSVIVNSATSTFTGTFVGDGSGLLNLPTPDISYTTWPLNILSGDGSTIIVNSASNTFTGTFVGDGSGLTNLPVMPGMGVVEGETYDINITGNVLGFDSSAIVNSLTNTFTGTFVGDGSGLLNLPTPDISYTTWPLNILSGDGSTIIVNSASNTFTGNFIGDGSGLTNLPAPDLAFIDLDGNSYKINILGDDSTILVNTTTQEFTGTFIGDLEGSVYTNSSSLVIDSITGHIYINDLYFRTPTLEIRSTDYDRGQIRLISVDDRSTFRLNKESLTDLATNDSAYGQVVFERNDINGYGVTSIVGGGNKYVYLAADENQTFGDSTVLYLYQGRLVLGKSFANVKTGTSELDIVGNGEFSGSLQAASIITNSIDSDDSSAINFVPSVTFSSDVSVENDLVVRNRLTVDTLEVTNFQTTGSGTPELESDTDILLTAGTRVEITQSPLKMASFTTTERNALTPQNGDVIYNTTDSKFQGYAGGTWVNLH